MAVLDENTLKKELAAGKLRNLYVICGNEPYLKEHYLRRLTALAVEPEMADFNLKKLDGTQIDVSRIRESAEQLPLMGQYQCCVVRNMPLAKLNSAEAQELGEYIRSVPDTTVLIFYLNDENFPPKSGKEDSPDGDKEKKKKQKEMFASFQEYACIVKLDRRSEREIQQLLMGGAKKRGCALSADNALLMLNLCGSDLHILLGELEKVCVYTGSGEISEEAIEQVCVKTPEATAFEIADSLFLHKTDKALRSLSILLEQKTPAQMILGSLIFPFIDMYRVKTAAKSSKNIRDLMKTFSYSSSFRLEKAQKNGRNLSDSKIRKCLAILNRADEQLKTGSGNDALVLEKTLVELGNVLC